MIHYFQLETKPKQLNQSVYLCSNLRGSVCKKGFTLIELLIYSGILVVVLLFTSEYLYSIGQARINNTARVEVVQNAQLIISKIKSDVTNSTIINLPTSSESNRLDLNIDSDHIIYTDSDTRLIRTINDKPDYLTSNQVKISNLSFNKIANPDGIVNIQIHFTVTSLAVLSGGRNVQESFQTTFSQR